MRIIEHPRVAHVGAMNREQKADGSQEGAGLSVSLHPVAWMQIWSLGDSGFILEGPGRFIDAMNITAEGKSEIIDWGLDHGLLEETVVYTVRYHDDELERAVEFEMPTLEAAEAEAEEYFDATIEPRQSTMATARLAELSGHDPRLRGPQYIPTDFQFDLVLNLYAEAECPDIDGVWWNERLDPDRHEAPRGVILPSRIGRWDTAAADFQALCEFQNTSAADRPRSRR
jgi:hypothetical protein